MWANFSPYLVFAFTFVPDLMSLDQILTIYALLLSNNQRREVANHQFPPKEAKYCQGVKFLNCPVPHGIRFGSVQFRAHETRETTGPDLDQTQTHHTILSYPDCFFLLPHRNAAEPRKHPTGPFLLPPVRPASPNFLRSARPPNPTNTTPVSFLGSNQSSVFFCCGRVDSRIDEG